MLKAKVAFGEDIRHWHYPTINRYAELVSFVEKTLKLDPSSSASSSSKKKEYYFQFEDAEMDRITIGNEQDLLDAFECAQQEKRPSLKIFVIQGSIHDTHEGQTSNPVEGGDEEEEAEAEEHVETEVKEECCADSKPEPERNWCEVALEFVLDEKVNVLFPEVVRRVVSVLREETKNNKQVLLAELVPRVLEEKTFEPIVQHELYQKYLKQILPVLLCQGECFIPILLSLNEAAISLWVADMLKLVTMTLGSEDHGLWNMHMDGWRQHANNEEAVHIGVKCDGCGVTPIRGVRYKCAICSDYDLCEKCETAKVHICSHPLVKMSRPRCGRHFGGHYFQGLWEIMGRRGGRGRCQRRHRAEEGGEFEFSFPYRFGFGFGHPHHHHGRRPWMRHACKNDSSSSSSDSPCKKECQSACQKECKRECKKWKKECKKECKKEKKWESKEDKKKCRLQNRKDKLLEKLNQINSKLSVEEEKKVESSEILNNNNESFEIMCICGAPLVQTIPTQAYRKCKWVVCDKCERNCSLNEVVFHCPTEKNPQHPSGYDVCSKCAIAIKEEKEKKEKKEEKPISEVVVEKKQEKEVPIPSAPLVVPPPEVDSKPIHVVDPFANFQYAAQARSLVDMGFSDISTIMSLLVSKNGNLEQVVAELLFQ